MIAGMDPTETIEAQSTAHVSWLKDGWQEAMLGYGNDHMSDEHGNTLTSRKEIDYVIGDGGFVSFRPKGCAIDFVKKLLRQ